LNNPTSDIPGVIAPPPLIDLAWFLGGVLVERAVPLPRLRSRTLGVPLVVGGAVLAGWAVATMRSAKTPLSPYESPAHLVTEGPFRFTRNPIYLGGILVYAGVALLLGRLGPLVGLPGLLTTLRRGVIEREELFLQRKFGEEYREYQLAVPRWLPP
jgi:protein-S-isoprenylcysteine O-methyltransferase Ste14